MRFRKKTQLSRFASGLCVAHIVIRCHYQTSQIVFKKRHNSIKIVLKHVEENATVSQEKLPTVLEVDDRYISSCSTYITGV